MALSKHKSKTAANKSGVPGYRGRPSTRRHGASLGQIRAGQGLQS